MFTPETKKGLAPRSWTTVGVWLVLAAVFVSRPIDTATAFIGAVKGTGEWVGYNVLADCGDTPPMEWMEPKTCPPTGDAVPNQPPTSPSSTQPDPIPAPSEGEATAYVVTVDDQSIRSLLDEGADTVLALHNEVEEIQDNGGLTIEVRTPNRLGRGGGS